MSVDDPGQEYHSNGRFVRPASTFRDFICKDPKAKFPAEKDRYALYLSPACPWAHRTMIVRFLKGLEDFIDLYLLESYMGPEGWFFSGHNGSLPKDPLYGFIKIRDLYHKADPDFVGRYTVPVLWDKETGTIVNNESSEILRMLTSEFDHLLPEHLREENRPGGGIFPRHLRDEIDEVNKWVYETVNNGVYNIGFSRDLEASNEGIRLLFDSLDRLEAMLGHRKPYLLGDTLTEADIRLYPTIVRFDPAYYTVFGCRLKMIRKQYPRLHLWMRKLYWDQDTEGPLRAAFWRSTQPYAKDYILNYVVSLRRVMNGGKGGLEVPSGPEDLIEPLPDNTVPGEM